MLELRRRGCKTIVGVLDLLPELRSEGGERMTTNREWLEGLAKDAPDELAAWFESEHLDDPIAKIAELEAQVETWMIAAGNAHDMWEKTESKLADVKRKLGEAEAERERYRNLSSDVLGVLDEVHRIVVCFETGADREFWRDGELYEPLSTEAVRE